MVRPAHDAESELRRRLELLLRRALLLDLELSHSGSLLKLGAVLGDNTIASQGPRAALELGSALPRLCQEATCVLGHNLVRHDLAVLQQRSPEHPLLRLPVIDTLVLSPLAFPENPYHRLVKDHKLARESVNDPVADARQAAVLFGDEFRAFAGLRQTEPELFELLRFLLTLPDGDQDRLAQGLALFFRALEDGDVAASRESAAGSAAGDLRRSAEAPLRHLESCRRFIAHFACAGAPVDEALFQTAAQRHALACTLAWLRVAGSNSVLPPWVRLQYPLTGQLIRRWREVPCASPDCAYCRQTHDARGQLKKFFQHDDFRPLPANPAGGSLQRDIIEAGLRDESLLAIMPTGGGKSLCFQLPALVRNYRRGVLTIVISPLQALMKDQVDGLVRRTGTPFAAALYGLLTMPERGDVLRRIVLGDVALLYVSPEQLRNKSFRDAIAQREIGCWIFDEAHCLSKWGHDFRPDYLYAGRFIREFSAKNGGEIPPIACFTATAKQDVKEEILKFFRDETGRELKCFEGGVERNNLRFEVQLITGRTKLERVHDLLADRLPPGRRGTAIVFRATREATVGTAQFLQAKGWSAAYFHAGLTAPEKKDIQDRFLAGEVHVICATNAFGMGIDKEDVRLVVHADTPGSLENYLQEAGRAGRDGQLAECVLLYDEEDCEQQFRLGAMSELSRRDIAQILRGLRRAARGEQEEVVITTGEILRDEGVDTDIALQERGADTKVRTAISWLERAGFIQRDENVTQVFQARLLVRTLAEAEAKIAPLNLSANEQALWLAILRELMNASATESLTVDRLAQLPELASHAQRGPGGPNPEFISAKVLKTLGSMSRAGLLQRDTLMNAFVRHKVADHSRLRLQRVLELDRKLVDLLATEEPDPEGWLSLNLRLLNQRLGDELSQASAGTVAPASADGRDARAAPAGGTPAPLSSTEFVRALLRSLSEDGRGFAGTHGSIDLRHLAQDSYRVRVRRPWTAISELAEKRRRVAAVVLDVLLAKIPADTPPRADLLVEFSFEELHDAIDRDLVLRSDIKDIDAALERGLMFLHEQRVIILQQGLAVFRSAMRIRLAAGAKGEKYKTADYQPLEHHYRERVLQVHVMSEYARRGLEAIREALALVLAYFSMGKEEFIRRYLSTRPELLGHATTAQSFQRIVTDLGNPQQLKIVTAPVGRNLLILAGPGSGKTRVVVHRCAYLLRVERVRPQSILVCCFNRSAAIELRRRLADLVGAEARGVTVLTYHALAMRLLGRSFRPAERSSRREEAHAGPRERQSLLTSAAPGEPDFDSLITDAVKLLRGETVPAGLEPDEVRERLLAGFQHILVDEYQDIDAPQYDLISALAGRTLDDADQKLSILAVGDDDQNIYTFRGANVEFIRRFAQDYAAEPHYLVENYRSTRCIIEASNQLIAANTDRMKTEHPIRINRHRALQPPGGEFGQRDALTRGKVQVIRVPDVAAQAPAVLAELRRLRGLGVADWTRIAVLAGEWADLAGVRALAEQEGIPVRWWPARSAMPPLHQVREIHRFLAELAAERSALVRANQLLGRAEKMFSDSAGNPWVAFLRRALEAWQSESDDAELPAQDALEFLYETCADSRREFSYGDGVTLSTVHAAKGTEHDHVLLIGAWRLKGTRAEQEEQRRAFYVGMTRARLSLAVFERADVGPTLPATLASPAILRRDSSLAAAGRLPPARTYEVLGLDGINLGFAGHFASGHPIHAALAALQPGDVLSLRPDDSGLRLHDARGTCVARLSQKAATAWQPRLASVREIRVLALINRRAEQDADPARCVVSEWEIPVVEFVCEALAAV
jgi:ATP-dependent DNA helicase RecQ